MFIRGFGRVDIVLFSSENIIVIENKINAEDQPKQLQRYFEACINLGYSSSKIYILYLNKSGVPITNHGKGNLRDEQFGRVNYKEDIIQWLDLCASEVKIYPHIEQNILQYKRLVSVLTGDNKSAKMKKSHIDLLYQDDNFKLAYELSQSFDGLQIDLQKNVWKELLIAFEQKGYSFQFCDKNLTSCDENKLVKNYYKSESRKNRFYGIQYEIDILEDYKIHCFIQLNHNLYYGITVSYNGKRIPYPDKLNKLAEKIASNYPVIEPDSKVRQSNEHWFLSVNILPSERVNFKEVSSIYKLIKQESRVNWVQATVDEVISFITEVKNYGYN